MSILGIESAIFGVDDLEVSTNFWVDFGLSIVSKNTKETVLEVQNGSKVVLYINGDDRLPNAFEGVGVKETVWGVDNVESLELLVKDLSTDHDVTRDSDGTAHLILEDGQPIALRVWTPKPFVSNPSPVNAPGNIQRLNQHRQWRHKAIPKTINHVVFFATDYVKSFEFYRDRLGFRYTDHSKGIGIFGRADGTFEHHTVFWVNGDLPFAPDGHGFMHIAFGLDDIDEVMLGANTMENKGWKNTSSNSSGGLCRHRISSAMYYYMDIPGGGGEAEYHADTDYVDDNWIPRAWNFKFGSLLWAHKTPDIFKGDDIPWEMDFDLDYKSFDEFRKDTKKPLPDELANMTEEDEHAI